MGTGLQARISVGADAYRSDRPAFKVLPSDVLLRLAQVEPADMAELKHERLMSPKLCDRPRPPPVEKDGMVPSRSGRMQLARRKNSGGRRGKVDPRPS